VIAYPKAWSSPTKGEVTGDVIYLDAGTVEQLAAYKGKLKGKFVLLDTVRAVQEWFEAPAQRNDAEDLLRMANAGTSRGSGRFGSNFQSNRDFTNALWTLLYEEK